MAWEVTWSYLKAFTIGTIVAFGSYLTTLYSTLQGLANAPVDFATSVVSFERVFEVIDLPLDILEKPDAYILQRVAGDLVFDHVTFKYRLDERNLLSIVKRPGQIDNVMAVLSGLNSYEAGDEERVPHSQAREDALENI